MTNAALIVIGIIIGAIGVPFSVDESKAASIIMGVCVVAASGLIAAGIFA